LKRRFSSFVLISTDVMLGLPGIVKIGSALGQSKVQTVRGLLSDIFNHTLAGVALSEIVVATICFFPPISLGRAIW